MNDEAKLKKIGAILTDRVGSNANALSVRLKPLDISCPPES